MINDVVRLSRVRVDGAVHARARDARQVQQPGVPDGVGEVPPILERGQLGHDDVVHGSDRRTGARVYQELSSSSPLIRCLWRADVDRDGEWTEPATEYWGVAFGTDAGGARTATVIGPSLVPRRMALRTGERSWGVELHAHVFWRGVDKLPIRGELRPLPLDGEFFTLAGVRYPVPEFDGLERLVGMLARQGTLVSDPHVARALSGEDPHLSERSMQRLFTRTTGLRRVQITQVRRAAQAYLMLQEGTPIADAAVAAGFADQAHLTRALRAFVGRTPARILAEAR